MYQFYLHVHLFSQFPHQFLSSPIPVLSSSTSVSSVSAPVLSSFAPVQSVSVPVLSSPTPVLSSSTSVSSVDVPVLSSGAPVQPVYAPVLSSSVPSSSTSVSSVDIPVLSSCAPVRSVPAPVLSLPIPVLFSFSSVSSVDVPVLSSCAPVQSVSAPVLSSSAPVLPSYTSVSSDDLPILSQSVSPDDATLRSLPTFSDMNTTDAMWSENVSCHEFREAINTAYMEIVHWRPNLFMLPSGSIGKCFVRELSSLFNAFSISSAYEAFAITAAMSMPAYAKSKTRDHMAYLEKRLDLWKKGDINSLLAQAKVIQSCLSSNPLSQKDVSNKPRDFNNLMKKGKVRAALQRLSKQSGNAILKMDDVIETSSGNSTVRQMLRVKHPHPQSVSTETILPSGEDDLNLLQIVFDSITTEVIKDSALKTEGAAGPSGVDAMCWRRLCTAFGEASNDLCSALACTANRICVSYIDPKSLTAYTACRLIPLNKNPVVRPIGIGEVVRRIIGKAVKKVITNVKWNSACWERKEKSEKPATAGLEPRVSD